VCLPPSFSSSAAAHLSYFPAVHPGPFFSDVRFLEISFQATLPNGAQTDFPPTTFFSPLLSCFPFLPLFRRILRTLFRATWSRTAFPSPIPPRIHRCSSRHHFPRFTFACASHSLPCFVSEMRARVLNQALPGLPPSSAM